MTSYPFWLKMAESSGGDRDEEFTFRKLFRDLNMHVDVGVRYYKSQRTETDATFYAMYVELKDQLVYAQKNLEFILQEAPKYDFVYPDGKRVKGNGFRSLLHVFLSCTNPMLKYLQACSRDRGGLLTTAGDHYKSLQPYFTAFKGLALGLDGAACLIKVDAERSGGEKLRCLFGEGEVNERLRRMALLEDVERECFYGECLGFQYASYLKHILQVVVIAMATYDQWFCSDKSDPMKQMIGSLWKGSRYVRSPAGRGEKVAKLTQHSHILFTKAFWNIFELTAIRRLMKLASPSLDVATTFNIPAKGVHIEGEKGPVTIPPPFNEEIGYAPVAVTLLSAHHRDGQKVEGTFARRPSYTTPASDMLIFHIHGGGFVSQSVKTHERYLRVWARELDVPIISIEYSHSPEGPFPRALDECTLVYGWMLQNMEPLGTTGKRIVLVGDSAGGNLVLALALKIKELGLRCPDGIVSVYPCLLVRSLISPARMLAIMDPLLPVGILFSCLQAYAGAVPDEATMRTREELRELIWQHRGKTPVMDQDEDAWEYVKRKASRFKWRKKKEEEGEKTEGTNDGNESSPPPESRERSSSLKKQPPIRPPPPKGSDSALVRSNTVPRRPPPPRPSVKPSADSDHDADSHSDESLPDAAFLDALFPDSSLPDSSLPDNSLPVASLPDALLPDVSLPSDASVTPGLLEEDKEPTVEGTALLMGNMQLKEETTSSDNGAAILQPTDKDSNLPPLKRYPPEIEKLAEEVIASYDDPEVVLNPYMSPYLASPEMIHGLPPVYLVAAELDPMLDDAVQMARRLQSLGQEVHLDVMPGMCHGFLAFTGNPDVTKAVGVVTGRIRSALGMTPSSTHKE